MATLPEAPQSHLPITPTEARSFLSTGVWGEDPAVKLVVQDAERAENWENTKMWILQNSGSSILYQSPETPRTWPGTGVAAASVPMFTVATATNALTPQIVNGLFSENPPFAIEERAGTTAQAARAIQALLAYQLEDINFREEIRLGTTNTILFGTGIYKWGWEKFTKERTVYKRKNPTVNIPSTVPGAPPTQITDDEIEEEVLEEVIDRPTFEHIVNLKHVLVDPGLNVPDIRKAKYVIHRMYMTWNDLDKLRDRPDFKIPSREKLLELFLPAKEPVETNIAETDGRNALWDVRAEPRYDETTINPFEEPLEILERWDNDTYIVVLQQKLVLCNVKNPYGKIPFFSVGWWDVPEAFYGLGIGRTIGAEQRLQSGITNLWLDQASLNLNGVYIRVKGKSIPTQNIRIAPGKIIEVDDKDGFQPLARTPAVPEAQQHLILSQGRAEQVSGANEAASQGLAGDTGHSNLARSAAGANLIAAGSGNRISDFIEKLSNQVIVPFLYEMYEMNRAMLPVSQLQYILNDELEHEYLQNGGDLIELLNARVKFSINAGAKMQTRRNMAQALPILTQFLTNQQTENQLAISGKKINLEEIIRMQFEVSDWHNEKDVIVPMTPDDVARQQQLQQGAQQGKLQGQAALEDQKFQHQQQLADEENTARAARDVLREQFKASALGTAVPGAENGL